MRLLLIAGLFLVSACAAPQNVFVLLPNEDGKTGSIEVHNKGGVQVIDQPHHATRVASVDSKPGAPMMLSESEIDKKWNAVLRSTPLPPRTFILYFRWDTDRLTAASEAQLPKIMADIKKYPAAELSIVGHTDRVGTTAWNAGLSLRRAQTIKALLLKAGLRHDLIDVESHGENNPLVPTRDGVPEPRNRRVEATIR